MSGADQTGDGAAVVAALVFADEPDWGVVVDSVGEHEPIDGDTVVGASTGGRALIGLPGQRVAVGGAVVEVPTALVEVLGAGPVPLRRRRTVRVDPFGSFEEIRRVITKRCFDPRSADGVAGG